MLSWWAAGSGPSDPVLKKGAIIECSKGEKGHGPVAIQGALVTVSCQALNPPEEKFFGTSSNQPCPQPVKAGGVI